MAEAYTLALSNETDSRKVQGYVNLLTEKFRLLWCHDSGWCCVYHLVQTGINWGTTDEKGSI